MIQNACMYECWYVGSHASTCSGISLMHCVVLLQIRTSFGMLLCSCILKPLESTPCSKRYRIFCNILAYRLIRNCVLLYFADSIHTCGAQPLLAHSFPLVLSFLEAQLTTPRLSIWRCGSRINELITYDGRLTLLMHGLIFV